MWMAKSTDIAATGAAYRDRKNWIKLSDDGYDLRLVLDDQWRSIQGDKPLKLTNGKHVVRYRWAGNYPESGKPLQPDKDRPVLAWSNPVDITIIPVAWGEPADGIRVGVALSRQRVRAGETPECWWCIQNVSNRPRAVWLGEEDLVSISQQGGPTKTYCRGIRDIRGVLSEPRRVVLKPDEIRTASVDLNLLSQNSFLPDSGDNDGLFNPIENLGEHQLTAVYDPDAPEALFSFVKSRRGDYPDVLFRRIESAAAPLTVVAEHAPVAVFIQELRSSKRSNTRVSK